MKIDKYEQHATQEALKQMRQTEGWKILADMLIEKYNGNVRQLVKGTSLEPAEIARLRAQCKTINMVLNLAGAKEI